MCISLQQSINCGRNRFGVRRNKTNAKRKRVIQSDDKSHVAGEQTGATSEHKQPGTSELIVLPYRRRGQDNEHQVSAAASFVFFVRGFAIAAVRLACFMLSG